MGLKNNKEAASIIQLYLSNEKTLQELQDYSWEKINAFSKNDHTDQSTHETENVFWFAIWQIQHLANEEHALDGSLERELKLTLQYLLNQSPMPPDTYGLPPNRNIKKKTVE